MDNLGPLRDFVVQLNSATTGEVKILEKLTTEWQKVKTVDAPEILQNNIILRALAKAMEENFDEWCCVFPSWIHQLSSCCYYNKSMFSMEQTRLVIESLRKYVLSGCWDCVDSFCTIAGLAFAPSILLEDDELYRILLLQKKRKKERKKKKKRRTKEKKNKKREREKRKKKEKRKEKEKREKSDQVATLLDIMRTKITKSTVVSFFQNCATLEAWQKKIGDDKQLVLDLIACAKENSKVWILFSNLARHPDAKVFLPNEIKETAATINDNYNCVRVYTLLCSDHDITKIALDVKWIEAFRFVATTLLEVGKVAYAGAWCTLISTVLSIANLSVVDSLKGELGKKTIKSLVRIVTEDNLPNTFYVSSYLLRSRQEASRALWNLAYLESNRTLIAEDDGLKKLQQTLLDTSDELIKKNIDGVVYMCAPVVETSIKSKGSKGHVMLSYNWENQPIVKKLAQSLKEHGYNIWLDIEQMGGSTLEAMAQAVENSALILMCVSQKYKDSPNCRLEGEYCVNKRKLFVPLMMQKNYSADGWLGLALGAKLWHDFSTEDNWDLKIAQLMKEMGENGKGKESHDRSYASLSAPPPAKKGKQLCDWTIEDMHNWMKEERVEYFFETFIKHHFNGNALAGIKTLRESAPKIFFGIFKEMCKEMEITAYGDILQLYGAICKL